MAPAITQRFFTVSLQGDPPSLTQMWCCRRSWAIRVHQVRHNLAKWWSTKSLITCRARQQLLNKSMWSTTSRRRTQQEAMGRVVPSSWTLFPCLRRPWRRRCRCLQTTIHGLPGFGPPGPTLCPPATQTSWTAERVPICCWGPTWINKAVKSRSQSILASSSKPHTIRFQLLSKYVFYFIFNRVHHLHGKVYVESVPKLWCWWCFFIFWVGLSLYVIPTYRAQTCG